MTVYGKFKKLDVDFSHLGLEQRDTHSDYFCTPKGAKVIGWEGVDGIHYCFVQGFGETVFAVDPSDLPGGHVHPLARNFEDFLRLLLACGSTAAMEQAWMWDRGEFNAFMEAYPPGPEQQAALDILRDKLSLAPMGDPYGYIKEVQSSFDYGQIPYSKEYYELVPEEPGTQGPPERPEWKVYFANGFGSYHVGHDRPGKEIPVNKTFTWGGKVWHVPAVYSCGKGLVVDLCVEIGPAILRAFVEKWQRREEGPPLTPEEQELQMIENPMNMDHDIRATVNGRELRRHSGTGSGWVPMSCRPQEEQGAYDQQDWAPVWLMEHYELDPELGWMFLRDLFPWATLTKPKLKTLTLSLEQQPVSIPGPRFKVSKAGDTVPFAHPVTGETHILRVVEYEAQEVDLGRLPDDREYPNHYTAMSYVVEPELPRGSLTVRDCGQGDPPRLKPQEPVSEVTGSVDGSVAACSVGIIGGADGPTVILLSNGKTGQTRSVCSALRFAPLEEIEWRIVFHQKTVEDIEVDLPLPQD